MEQVYQGEKSAYIAYPVGGIGAGMFCLQGSGSLGQFSLRNHPDLNNEPYLYAAVCLKGEEGNTARVLEGQVPDYKIFGRSIQAGNGQMGYSYGLPRFEASRFSAQFPFGRVVLTDPSLPVEAEIEAFSPFIPGDADNSSLPAATLTYKLKNVSEKPLEGVFYFHSMNFMSIPRRGAPADAGTMRMQDGFLFRQEPRDNDRTAYGEACITTDDPEAVINTDWFRGGWFDSQTMAWKDVEQGALKDGHNVENLSPGGSVQVPFRLAPGGVKEVALHFAWYVPYTNLNYLPEDKRTVKPFYTPWYAGRFDSVHAVMEYYRAQYQDLRGKTELFTKTFSDTNLPEEVVSAIDANLPILKSPTILRQTDGRMWAWEGCHDTVGSCAGSCTHVWNYAQAICHLFPELERSLRHTELKDSLDENGHQAFRAFLPIQKAWKTYHAASDGQLGGIMKMYREWRIKGDNEWLAEYWDDMVRSINYCISIWDPEKEGVLKLQHHNTYDIEFWGADSMCSSFYLGALKAISLMGEALGKDVALYREIFARGKKYVEEKLFNGEYFYQETSEWQTLMEKHLNIPDETAAAAALRRKEGPKYQYGTGCLSDAVVGAWLAKMCGLGDILDPEKVKSHLKSVYRYNFRRSLKTHANPQRSGYALGKDGGLLLCSWPNGGKPSLPFIYSDEVWTGIEYQVACHMFSFGMEEEALNIVRTLRKRYDGERRNPFDEYECGHWYGRALASYGMIEGITGVRYDAVEQTLHVSRRNTGYRSFLATETGFGTVSVHDGKVEVKPVSGTIPVERIAFDD